MVERVANTYQGSPFASEVVVLPNASVTVLTWLEAYLSGAAGSEARPELPWRQTLLVLASSPLLRAAAGPLREPLWGEEEHHPRLARLLVLNP